MSRDPSACSFNLSARLFLPNTQKTSLLAICSGSYIIPNFAGLLPGPAERLYSHPERLAVYPHALAFGDATVQVDLPGEHLGLEVVPPTRLEQLRDAGAPREANPDALLYLEALLASEVLHLVDQLPHEPLVEELPVE